MFESLGDRLQSAVNKIRGYGKITEDNISEVTREIRLALLEADVNYKVVKEFINNVKEKALGEEVIKLLEEHGFEAEHFFINDQRDNANYIIIKWENV